MTKINSNERPELCNLLNDLNKYPELFIRFQKLKNGHYDYENNFLINKLNSSNLSSDDIKKEESINDINKIFFKRSNSMEHLV